MVFIIFLFINSFNLFYIIFFSESIISLCHQLRLTTFWMPWVIKTYHTHTPDRLCRYSPPWCVLSTGAYYLCFLVQLLVPAYYTQVRTVPREIRYMYRYRTLSQCWMNVGPPPAALTAIPANTHSKHDTLTQCWANVGLMSSTTLGQH